jgi:hypothetical protein
MASFGDHITNSKKHAKNNISLETPFQNFQAVLFTEESEELSNTTFRGSVE